MNESDLVVVFDLLDAGFRDWSFPAFGLIFVAIGVPMVCFSKPMMQLFGSTKHPRYFKIFSWVWLGFAIFWTVTAFTAMYGSYHSLRSAYVDGNFQVVKGPVENFVPMPSSGHSYESFTVAGQRFSYSDYEITPGYNNSRSHGGAIDAGVYVRISHVGGEIVKLEMEKSAAKMALLRPAKSIWSPDPKNAFPPKGSAADLVFRHSWILMVLWVVATASLWRWRGRSNIARNPSLRTGYNRMTLGFCMWLGIPTLAIMIASIFGNVHAWDMMLGGRASSSGSLWSTLILVAWGGVIAKWVYWTFFQNGAAKMAIHPGLIDHEWVAKLWPSVLAVGYLAQIILDAFD